MALHKDLQGAVLTIDLDAIAANYRTLQEKAGPAETAAVVKSNAYGLGVEKIGLSSVVVERPEIVQEIAETVGGQSVVAVLDVKKRRLGGYHLYTHNGRRKSGRDLLGFAKELEALVIGAWGEAWDAGNDLVAGRGRRLPIGGRFGGSLRIL